MNATTKTKKQVAIFKIKSTHNFITFLKRFSSVEKALLLELTPDNMIAKSHTPDRSTIKYSRLALSEVLEGAFDIELLKIAVLDIHKVINIFKHFNEGDEIFLDVSFDTINDENIAFSLKFYTTSLKITLTCADPNYFTYISSDALKRILKSVVDEKILDFGFPKEAFSKINSLCEIDAKDDLLKIKVRADVNEVTFKSKSFEYNLPTPNLGKEAEIAFYNSQFSFIDQETSTFSISPNKLLVSSEAKKDSDGKLISQTLIILGRIER